MDIYDYELGSYIVEIDAIIERKESIIKSKNENLTYAMLSHSNRSNFVLVGLCSLVEAFLYEYALEVEKSQSLKLDEIRKNGIEKLKSYLSQVKALDFSRLKSWESFTNLSKIRNSIIHSYGGLVESKKKREVVNQLSSLGFQSCWVMDKRIRLNSNALLVSHKIVQSLIEEIKEMFSQQSCMDEAAVEPNKAD